MYLQGTELLVAGFPCTDVSRAGARRGLDGEASHLHPHCQQFCHSFAAVSSWAISHSSWSEVAVHCESMRGVTSAAHCPGAPCLPVVGGCPQGRPHRSVGAPGECVHSTSHCCECFHWDAVVHAIFSIVLEHSFALLPAGRRAAVVHAVFI